MDQGASTGVQSGDPRGTALCGGKRDGRNGPCGAVEEHAAQAARFVRMTLSFSKSEIMHEACLLLFLHRSHRDRALHLT
jgi:hypothetical protein